MTTLIEKILNQFPEVTWDRWTGEIGSEFGIGVYGWIERQDGKSDFMFIRIDNDGAWMFATSSAKYSAEFSRRLNFEGSSGHEQCKRVENYFKSVKATALSVAKG